MNNMKRTALFAALAASFAGHSTYAAPAPDHCYDFSDMSEDASYTVGDVIETKFATITIKPYVFNGNVVSNDVQRAESIGQQIAGGSSPELYLKLVALNVVPKKPVSRITTQIAQNVGQNGGYADSGVGVNRKGFKSPTGFSSMDGKVLGTNAKGKAKISANVSQTGDGYWHTGTLEFNAVQGSIESIRLGGHTWRIDNMCFTL